MWKITYKYGNNPDDDRMFLIVSDEEPDPAVIEDNIEEDLREGLDCVVVEKVRMLVDGVYDLDYNAGITLYR